jgi:hypothetical protein
MDPNEIIKHVPEVLKGGAALASALKFTDVVKAMLGPAAAEVAERIHDKVRLYRFGRQLECLKKAEKMAKDAGLTPKAVPIKVLFPLLEGASLEENEDLHDMWAALLANAASPETADKVRPGFIAILKQMAPDEAYFLNEVYSEQIKQRHGDPLTFVLEGAGNIVNKLLRSKPTEAIAELEMCVDGLESLRLVTQVGSGSMGFKFKVGNMNYSVTRRGIAFLEACRPPAPKLKPKSKPKSSQRYLKFSDHPNRASLRVGYPRIVVTRAVSLSMYTNASPSIW